MSTFNGMYHRIKKHGKIISPRGQKTLEIENAVTVFQPYERFANFPSRKLSLNYVREELLWYLKGDREDLSICDSAKLWREMITDGKINSNYGHAIFRQKQLDYAVDCLTKDPDSRRALIVILDREHLYPENKDVPCTVSLSFRIRDDKLCATAHMRSADAIYGTGNDIPFFSFVQECVLTYLNSRFTVPFGMGTLTLFAESLHVYEKHWQMLEKLLVESPAPVDCPKLSGVREIEYLRHGGTLQGADPHYKFTGWLYTRETKK